MRKEQAAFIAEKFLDRFKDGYDVVDENNLPVLQQYLNAAGRQFQLLIKANLDADGSISTGALMISLSNLPMEIQGRLLWR